MEGERPGLDPIHYDLVIIGAGPAGIHAACTAQDLGLTYRIIDRCGLAHSFVEYPQALRFFSPPDEMEVGGIPFPIRGGDKPSREDILPYFRAVAEYRKLQMSLWEPIVSVEKHVLADSKSQANCPSFTLTTLTPTGSKLYKSRMLVLASGVWDVPNTLHCEGHNLSHVAYRFHEPTEYFGLPVLVVGGGNSAVHAALTLAEAHAAVTLAMRREPIAYQSHLRPFVVRDLQFAVDAGRVTLHAGVRVSRIEPDVAWLQPILYDCELPDCGAPAGAPYPVNARFVFALIGQSGDPSLFRQLGLNLDSEGRPLCDPETYETEVKGVYSVGSLAGQKIDIIIAAREQTARVVRRIAARLALN